MVSLAFNPGSLEAEAGVFKGSLVYITSFSTAGTTLRDLVSNKSPVLIRL